MRRREHTVGTRSVVEPLESRRLLSITPILSVGVSPALIGSVPVSTSPTQGVTLHEKAGVSFTAGVGTFTTAAPAEKLIASIAWGDGTTSKGVIVPLPNAGIVPLYEVDGTHTYQKAGNFLIKVTVVQPGPTPMLPTSVGSPIKLIASWYSHAIVVGKNVLLDGTIKGTYSLAPTAFTLGAGYVFNGTGTAGDLGNVNAHGVVFIPAVSPTAASITGGRAFGTLTLTQVGPQASAVVNSVTLSLVGPPQAVTDGFPSTLTYKITGGSGLYAGATGTGTIAATLNSDGTFSFVLTSVTPVV